MRLSQHGAGVKYADKNFRDFLCLSEALLKKLSF